MDKQDFIHVDPDVMHGTPVFKHSRVPIDTLFDYLETGETLDEFLDDFPSVKREYAEKALEYSRQLMVA